MDSNKETANLEHDDDMIFDNEGGLDEMPDYVCMHHETTKPDDGMSDMPDYVCMLHETTKPDDDGIDRISDMPDLILCKILSFLPTKYAMAAKILSTRWGTLFPFFWISPIVIDIDDSLFFSIKNTKNHNLELRTDIHKFTDKLLSETLPRLDILKITCVTSYGDDMKISWVRAALQLHVRELSFTWYMIEPEKMFLVLNGYTAFTTLKLHLEHTDICSPDVFVLPNLKPLVLCDIRIYFGDEERVDFLNNLMNCFPVLEDLSLTRCNLRSYHDNDSRFSLSIRCPQLKNSTIEECKGIWNCNLEIDTPNLEVLLFKGHAAASYNDMHFKSLILADIDVEFSWLATGVEEFLTACSGVVHLNLSAYVIDAIHISRAELQIFKNLNRLELGFIQLHGWAILARLLLNSPNLQKLTFKQGFCLHNGGYSNFESLVENGPLICLEQHLKEIEFCVFEGKKDEIKLVEYFLTNGKATQTIKLYGIQLEEKTTQRLCMLPGHSKLIFNSDR